MKPYFNRLAPPPPLQIPNTHHRPKLMKDKKLEIREFGLAGCFSFFLYCADKTLNSLHKQAHISSESVSGLVKIRQEGYQIIKLGAHLSAQSG